MAETRLVAEPGRPTGSAASRRLRHAGRIPAVVYGHGMEPLPVSVGARDLRAALAHGVNQLLTLEVGGSTHMVLARQLQRHPVRRTVSHVDFQVVRRDEVVTVEVPIVAVGEASAVEREGGIVEHPMSTLTVRSTPGRIPENVTVDLSKLEPGGALRVRDIALPAGVTTDIDPDEVVVVAAAPTVEVKAEQPEAAEATVAEGAGHASAARASEGGAAEEA
jgi:large subunit ribosomal protein L25